MPIAGIGWSNTNKYVYMCWREVFALPIANANDHSRWSVGPTYLPRLPAECLLSSCCNHSLLIHLITLTICFQYVNCTNGSSFEKIVSRPHVWRLRKLHFSDIAYLKIFRSQIQVGYDGEFSSVVSKSVHSTFFNICIHVYENEVPLPDT